MKYNGSYDQWEDADCDSAFPFICEKGGKDMEFLEHILIINKYAPILFRGEVKENGDIGIFKILFLEINGKNVDLNTKNGVSK